MEVRIDRKNSINRIIYKSIKNDPIVRIVQDILEVE